MAFCSNCGKPLESSGRFCVHCGADTAAPASAGVAQTPSPVQAPAFQPVAGAPAQYAAPPYTPQGAIPPYAVAVPPPAPAVQKKGGMLGTLLVLAAIVGGGYYYSRHGKTPAPTPGAPGQSQALVQQQSFDAQWQEENGFLVLTSAKWTNSSPVPITSATVQCQQYDADGADLSQYRVGLNGPTPPSTATTYSNIQIGAIANGMTRVTCDIVHVNPAQ